MNTSGTKTPIPVKLLKTVSPPRIFNLLLDFVDANVPTYVAVYLFKRIFKILEYYSTLPYPEILLYSLHTLDNVCNTTLSVKITCLK